MGSHQDQFTELIHSELMPPFDTKGNSPLWEAIGRRFLNMDYTDADKLSRENREFILSLFPSDTIYGTLLPPEARNAIGKVGPETEPVKKMLESIGFCYTQEVDPFDGGPHYRARLKDITLVRDMIAGTINFASDLNHKECDEMLVAIPLKKDDFIVIKPDVKYSEKTILIDEKIKSLVPDFENRTTYAIPF